MQAKEAVQNPFLNPDFLNDPYPSYRELLAGDPLLRLDMLGGAWIVPRHADVLPLLMDPRLSARRSDALINQFPAEQRAELQDFKRLFSMWMLFYDPPQHHCPRKLLNRGFRSGRLREMKPRIQRLVDDLIRKVREKGRMDAISEFAHPLPVMVIMELLGVPSGDGDRFVQWSDDIAEFFGSSAATIEMAQKAQRSLVELTSYFQEIVPRRREFPGDDLISLIVGVDDAECGLSDEEIHAQCAMLLFAGHETTRNLIGNSLLALLRHPDQMHLLRRNPGLIRTAVEEFLRYDSPVQFGTRLSAEGIEVRGRQIKKGELIILLFGAANRDPREFPDPDRLDIARAPNRQVSFGYGPHMCLGRNLARLEAEVVINTLLRAFPSMELESEDLQWCPNFGFRGLHSLPIALGKGDQ